MSVTGLASLLNWVVEAGSERLANHTGAGPGRLEGDPDFLLIHDATTLDVTAWSSVNKCEQASEISAGSKISPTLPIPGLFPTRESGWSRNPRPR